MIFEGSEADFGRSDVQPSRIATRVTSPATAFVVTPGLGISVRPRVCPLACGPRAPPPPVASHIPEPGVAVHRHPPKVTSHEEPTPKTPRLTSIRTQPAGSRSVQNPTAHTMCTHLIHQLRLENSHAYTAFHRDKSKFSCHFVRDANIAFSPVATHLCS